MRNVIFLVVAACLLAGCGEKGPTVMKIKTEAEITSKQALPVEIKAQDKEPLPIKITPDEIVIRAFIASLIAVCATTLTAIAAWRAAYNARKALEKMKKRSEE